MLDPNSPTMSPNYQTREDEWLTIVAVKVDFKTRTFNPSFREKLRKSTSSKTKCNCSSLGSLHEVATRRDLIHGLLPTKTFTIRFLVASPENIQRAKTLCKTEIGRGFDNPKEFRIWILSLAMLLSELCESKHADGGRDQSDLYEFGMRPFRQTEPSKEAVCEALRRLLSTPLTPSEKQGHGMGYVYILRSQFGVKTMGELKIGFSKYHPERRAHELARCLARPEILSHTPLMPHAKRLESIVHAELQACRKVQSCPKCDREHREWFTVSSADARDVVTRWGTWMLQQPYRDGKLTDEWGSHLSKQDFHSIEESKSVADVWEAITDVARRAESKHAQSQHVGHYLNDCYWAALCHQLGLENFGKDYYDSLRSYSPFANGREGFNFNEVKEELDRNEGKLCSWGIGQGQYRHRSGDSDPKARDCNETSKGPGDTTSRQSRPNDRPLHPDALLSATLPPDAEWRRAYHPETQLRHLWNPDGSPGPLTRLLLHPNLGQRLDSEMMRKLDESIRSLKTASSPVSKPDVAVNESPWGDATLLPIIHIRDLEYMSSAARNWLGMTPTHVGFQYMQQAYQDGKWYGARPDFKLPKAYRRAGYKTLSPESAKSGPSLREKYTEMAEDGTPASDPMDTDQTPNQHYDQPSFQLTRGPGYDKFAFSAPLTDEFVQKLEQCVDEAHHGGRENIEKKLAKSFRDFGIDGYCRVPRDSDTSDSDSFISSDSEPSSTEQDAFGPSRSSPAKVSATQREPTGSGPDLIDQKKAKTWLESL